MLNKQQFKPKFAYAKSVSALVGKNYEKHVNKLVYIRYTSIPYMQIQIYVRKLVILLFWYQYGCAEVWIIMSEILFFIFYL